jgi:four helix bundle protein
METSSVVRDLEHTAVGAFLIMSMSRPAARTFSDLVVWRKAHEFVLAVYKFTADFPKAETYGLAVQMRRAAVSIPANVAEGFRRRGQADKARFMNMAEGSTEECRYYLILSKDLGYGDTTILNNLLEEVSRTLTAYTSARADFWLLTSISRRDIKGGSPCLVS